jgi:hypothetical protein
VSFKNGTVYEFQALGPSIGPHLEAVRDLYRNVLKIVRNPVNTETYQALRIVTPNGRWVEFTYQASTLKITQARDNAGRTVTYAYDASDR